jgi:haloalkane dehalogenase
MQVVQEPSDRLNEMQFKRTPDARFEDLTDFDFLPKYHTISDGLGGELRVHYLDEGPVDGSVVLLMHGEPSWCYLYRKMIPSLVAAGHRVIAPDLIGFGRSDKPTQRDDYTYQRHINWMTEWFNALDVSQVTLFCQDWGGLIGLRMVAAQPDRFAGVVVANTILPTGDAPIGDAFLAWQSYSQKTEEFDVGAIISRSMVGELSPEVVAAYDAPFPDDTYKAGARKFPLLVPTSADDPEAGPNREAWKILANSGIPFVTAFSDQDPVTRGGDLLFQKLLPGCEGQPHKTIDSAGHFLQEEKGEELAQLTIHFIEHNHIGV